MLHHLKRWVCAGRVHSSRERASQAQAPTLPAPPSFSASPLPVAPLPINSSPFLPAPPTRCNQLFRGMQVCGGWEVEHPWGLQEAGTYVPKSGRQDMLTEWLCGPGGGSG